MAQELAVPKDKFKRPPVPGIHWGDMASQMSTVAADIEMRNDDQEASFFLWWTGSVYISALVYAQSPLVIFEFMGHEAKQQVIRLLTEGWRVFQMSEDIKGMLFHDNA